MRFSVDERLFTLFPSLAIGVLICEIHDNTRYGDDGFEGVVETLRTSFPYEKPQDHPNVRVWREAFTKTGVSASKYLSSIESLLRRVLKGGPVPRVNPVVDLYNAISLKHLVPMGGHALHPLEGDIALCLAEGGEPFLPMDGGEAESAQPGEVIYRDAKEVLTRRWVWRQCDKDKVMAHTGSVFIPVDAMEGLPPGLCETVMTDMEQGLSRNGYGRVVHRGILTSGVRATEFTVPR
jgi:DNA/RNA-binding domain of Phe-tRNA-synthetase-like protein